MNFFWFLTGWGLPFGAYVALEAGAIVQLRNRWRFIAALPLPFMILLLVQTMNAEAKGADLWPLGLILFSPGAALGVLIVWIGGLIAARRYLALMVPALVVAIAVALSTNAPTGMRILWSGMFTLGPAAVIVAVAAAVETFFRLRQAPSIST